MRPDPSAPHLLGVAELSALLERRELTSVALVEQLSRRIAEIDCAGPNLCSVISLDPAAEARAAELDAARAAGARRGPLHGLPVLVKDNIDTVTQTTTGGSLALEHHLPAQDAPLVRRLREAGMVVLGKANLSEWANFRGRPSSSGWSAIGGQCRNPHAPDRSPGGSSSGSAAAVAAGLVPVSIGTETDGSIMSPGAANGIVGLKPTVGLVERTGIIPIAHSQDSAGPMGRSVLDAAFVLDLLAPAARGATRFSEACRADGLVARRVGVLRGPFVGHHRGVDRLFEESLGAMRAAGAVLIDPVEMPAAAELADRDDEMTVLLHEFHAGIDSYLAAAPTRAHQPRSLAELTEFNEAHADRELELFGQELFEQALATNGLDDPVYLAALARNRERGRARGIDAALSSADAEVLVAPTSSPAWLIDHVNGDARHDVGYTAAAIAGYPSLTLPIGKVAGLPVGLCLMAPAFGEERLIQSAFALECELALGASIRPFVGDR